MIYHVTRSASHHVVTVNADTAQDAARIAVIHGGISEWVELLVIQPAPRSADDETVVVGAAA